MRMNVLRPFSLEKPMKRKVQKPFDIEAWKNGAKVETRDGHQVKILCADVKNDCRIVGLIIRSSTCEVIRTWYEDGHFFNTKDDDDDLVIVEEIEEPEKWADNKNALGEGWYITYDSKILQDEFPLNDECNQNVFASEKLAKSARAMARISQLMKHDKRYGGIITDEEWEDYSNKPAIVNSSNKICMVLVNHWHVLLSFHTQKQCDLFLKENERLVKDYLMID